jgi:hypothetical protein
MSPKRRYTGEPGLNPVGVSLTAAAGAAVPSAAPQLWLQGSAQGLHRAAGHLPVPASASENEDGAAVPRGYHTVITRLSRDRAILRANVPPVSKSIERTAMHVPSAIKTQIGSGAKRRRAS